MYDADSRNSLFQHPHRQSPGPNQSSGSEDLGGHGFHVLPGSPPHKTRFTTGACPPTVTIHLQGVWRARQRRKRIRAICGSSTRKYGTHLPARSTTTVPEQAYALDQTIVLGPEVWAAHGPCLLPDPPAQNAAVHGQRLPPTGGVHKGYGRRTGRSGSCHGAAALQKVFSQTQKSFTTTALEQRRRTGQNRCAWAQRTGRDPEDRVERRGSGVEVPAAEKAPRFRAKDLSRRGSNPLAVGRLDRTGAKLRAMIAGVYQSLRPTLKKFYYFNTARKLVGTSQQVWAAPIWNSLHALWLPLGSCLQRNRHGHCGRNARRGRNPCKKSGRALRRYAEDAFRQYERCGTRSKKYFITLTRKRENLAGKSQRWGRMIFP